MHEFFLIARGLHRLNNNIGVISLLSISWVKPSLHNTLVELKYKHGISKLRTSQHVAHTLILFAISRSAACARRRHIMVIPLEMWPQRARERPTYYLSNNTLWLGSRLFACDWWLMQIYECEERTFQACTEGWTTRTECVRIINVCVHFRAWCTYMVFNTQLGKRVSVIPSQHKYMLLFDWW